LSSGLTKLSLVTVTMGTTPAKKMLKPKAPMSAGTGDVRSATGDIAGAADDVSESAATVCEAKVSL
jgi:hypothetical protein